jgi:hypothetical protein
MTHTLTSLTGFWRKLAPRRLQISLGIDHGMPGSHLIWHIVNTSDREVIVTRLLVHGQRGSTETVTLGLPHVLAPRDEFVMPMDVDWTLLHARSAAVVDVDGREYKARRAQLAALRAQMRDAIDRWPASLSARDFLSGAADLAFGVAILGLGFFMLLYAIANG